MDTQTRIETRTVRLDPRGLKLLDLNARYMRHEVFQRLVENIRRDGGLTGNTPFAWRLHDDTTGEPVDPETYEVLSGNHRVKAAIAAEIDMIDVTVTDDYLPTVRRRAIQLSHNALAGEDDPAVLRTIYESIGDVELRLYTGLDDKALNLLTDISVSALSEAGLDFQTIGVTFLPHERDAVEDAWTQARKVLSDADGYWLARWDDYDRLMDALEAAGQAYGVKNTATALMVVLDIFWRHVDELQDGYLAGGEPVDPKRAVPTVSVIGLTMPAALAAKIRALGADTLAALDAHLGNSPDIGQEEALTPNPSPSGRGEQESKGKRARNGSKSPETGRDALKVGV